MHSWGAILDASAINGAEYTAKHASKEQFDPAVVKAEIFLDRARAKASVVLLRSGISARVLARLTI